MFFGYNEIAGLHYMYDLENYRQERRKRWAEVQALLTPEDKAWADRNRAEQAAYDALPIGKKNERNELAVFIDFAAVAGIDVDPGSVVNAPSPEPDIRCTREGKPHYFELSEITDQKLARCSARAFKYDEQTVTAFSYDCPLKYIIEKKSTRKYTSGGAPVELVLYYQTQHAPPSWHFSDLRARNMAGLEALVLSGLFRRVWIFDAVKKLILWPS